MKILMLLISIPLLFFSSSLFSETVYRYKDENGRWQFSDKKPKNDHEQIKVASKRNPERPLLTTKKTPTGKQLTYKNPWFAPVTFEILIDEKVVYQWVAEPKSSEPVFKNEADQNLIKNKKYGYHYRLGRVIKKSDGEVLRPPIPDVGKFRVSQGFNGRFSHSEEPSRYAVDIAMNISDNIHAARDGVVVFVKDDYHMGGTDKFFLDKANHITILHEDDTFGVYGHILLGSALVKPGDKVKAGDPIANAGTSGYSTGPHLHFVIRYNNGTATVSSPFEFEHAQGVGRPVYKQQLQIAPAK